MAYLIFGSGGVGPALAKNLSNKGCRVHVVGRNRQALESLAKDVQCTTTVCDVLRDEEVQRAVAEATVDHKLSGLAFCVGSIPLKPLKATTLQDFMDAFRLNVVSAAEAIKHAQPALANAKGSVVLFSSVAAQQGFANHSLVASAKAGVQGLTLSLASEFAPLIRVNCIAPSLTDTPLSTSILRGSNQIKESLGHLHPLNRIGKPEDIASLAAFLLSGESDWITGQIIGVDGGRSTLRGKNC